MIRPNLKIRRKIDKKIKRDTEKFDIAMKKGYRVVAGYFGDKTYADGTVVSNVAFWQEFGTARIPSRPFMRNSLIQNSSKYRRQLAKQASISIKGRRTVIRSLEQIGSGMVKDIRRSIWATTQPPLARMTIERKGFAKPLIGLELLLLNTASYEVRKRDDTKI